MLSDQQEKTEVFRPSTDLKPSASDMPNLSEVSTDSPDATAAITETFTGLTALPREKFSLAEIFKTNRHGGYQTDLNRHKAKLIQATAPLLLDKIFAEGEQVHKIASGIAYFRFEIPYANGLLTWPLNYYALVVTNQRLLMINLDRHLSRPDRYVFQAPLQEITEVSRGVYGSSLIVKLKSGQVWDFTTVKRALAKELIESITGFINEISVSERQTDLYPQLCPFCFQPVPERVDSCPYCHTTYKSVGEAIKKSLIFPGLGAIYLSYKALGIAEMIGYLITWLLTIILVIIGIPGGIFGGGMLVLSYHLVSAFMAGRMARKGHLPETQLRPEPFSDHEQLGNAPG